MSEKRYGIVTKIPEKRFRFYVDGDWTNAFETREEADDAMEKWIEANSLSSCFKGLEYEFEEATICEVVVMKIVEEVKKDDRKSNGHT